MRRILFASLKGHARRFIAGSLAIVLGVGFVAAILIAMDSVKGGLAKAVAAQYSNADLIVTDGYIDDKAAARVAKVEGVEAVSVAGSAYGRVKYPDGSKDSISIGVVPGDEGLRWQELKSGNLPDDRGQVAVTSETATEKKISVGATITLESGATGKSFPFKVVGIVNKTSITDGAPLYIPEKSAKVLNGGDLSGDLLVRIKDGADASSLKTAVGTAAASEGGGSSGTVRTGDEQVTEALSELSGGVDIVGGFLLGFTAIAMFVSMLVVANTFTIVIAQRARELALFRCVGAAKSQVFRAVVVESIIVGLVASAVGILAGAGIAQTALSLLRKYVAQPLPVDSLSIQPTAIVIPVVIGTLTTLVAALAPARRATRVPPLAALHPEAAIRVRSKAGAFRLVVGFLLLLGGGLLMAMGISGEGGPISMLYGVGGGFLSFLGVLLFSPILSPLVVRLLGLIARATGVPGQVSADNAVRNPRRTAATASALLVGVTLISLLTVGAASAQATADYALDKTFPLDLSVMTKDSGDKRDNLSTGTVGAVGNIEGVESVATLTGVRLGTLGESSTSEWAYGLDPKVAAETIRNPRSIDGLAAGTVILSPGTASQAQVSEGSPVKLQAYDDGTGKAGSITLKAHVVNEQNTPNIMLTQADLAKLDAKAPVVGLWGKVKHGADVKSLTDDLGVALKGLDEPSLEGAAPIRGIFNQIIDGMLMVAVGLLAMSVLIALVGVGNTLSLSVLERIRENALLRALGLTRMQLRATLAIEALLIAGAAVVIGGLLGVIYGFVGTSTIFANVGAIDQMQFAIPWDRLGLIALVALAAGVLASVLPARRAAKVPPSAALTAE